MTVTLLGVPTSAGAYGPGQEAAPRALRKAGLTDALVARGVDVVDGSDTRTTRFEPDPDNPTAQNLDRVVRVAGEVRGLVADVIGSGALPVVIGGDCTITLGAIAGLLDADLDPVVAYVDGDLDLFTPARTRSGILDAMGVAHMLDIEGVADPLASLAGRRPLLEGPSLALIGYEDIEEREVRLLDDRGVHCFPAAELRTDPTAVAHRALDALGGRRPLLVHFDVDVIDSIDCPLAHFPHFNTGANLAAVSACLERLGAAPNFCGLVVTEVNPWHDPDGSQLRRLVDTVARTVAAGTSGR